MFQEVNVAPSVRHQVPVPQPAKANYLFENWKRAVSTACSSGWRRVKVKNGIATIVSDENDKHPAKPQLLIRSPVEGCPDGFYSLGVSELRPLRRMGTLEFPDPDDAMPVQAELHFSDQPIGRDDVRKLIAFVEEVRSSDNCKEDLEAQVVFDAQHIYSRFNSALYLKSTFGLPFRGAGVSVRAELVKIALTECLRYDYIKIAHDNTPGGHRPVIFGLDWDHCALVWPTFSDRKI